MNEQDPPRRYTRRHPGELVHLDVKKLGRISGFYGHRITGDRRRRRRGAGWDFVHVAIDDASRLAYAEVLPNEHGDTSAAFLARAVAWFRRKAIRVREVMTDNGSGYVSACFGLACARLASSISGRGPTARAPTVRRSGSSRRCYASGPTYGPTGPRGGERRRCRSSSATTTASARTVVWAGAHQSAGLDPGVNNVLRLHRHTGAPSIGHPGAI